MAHRVRFAERALEDAEEYRRYILKQSNDGMAAESWLAGLFKESLELKNLPASYPLIPEHKELKQELRQIIYASHRVIFRIDGQTVMVVRVYHASARPLRSLAQRPRQRKPS